MIDFDPLMSGKRRGISASLCRGVLRVASWGYRAAVAIRNRRFDRGVDVHRVDAPVLCVGNLTTGGTGKTPVVCLLATRLRARGIRVAIVSRGYGRGEAGVNDEAMELYDRLPDVPHVQDPDRVAAARIAIDELESQFILMDDGFGHRRLHRDADVVLVDATNPFGHGYLLPRGLMREPIESIRRAAVVILTRCDQVDRSTIDSIRRRIEAFFGGPILQSSHVAGFLRDHAATLQPIDKLIGAKVALVSAIGNPDAFERSVCGIGGDVVDHYRLPDHAAIDAETMSRLRGWAETLEADFVVCTHKDLVKLQIDRLAGKPLFALQIDLQLDDPEGHLDRCLENLIDQASDF